jgi:hypothetical protein
VFLEAGGVVEIDDARVGDFVLDLGKVFLAPIDGEHLGAEAGEFEGKGLSESSEADDTAFHNEWFLWLWLKKVKRVFSRARAASEWRVV